MNTKDMLKKLPENHRRYLEALKSTVKRAEELDAYSVASEDKATARGYIRCLVESGIVDDFNTVWCWFTV